MKSYDLKWLLVGLLIALFNPLFSGLIIGFAYLGESRLRREGAIVIGFALVWKIVLTIYLKNLLP